MDLRGLDSVPAGELIPTGVIILLCPALSRLEGASVAAPAANAALRMNSLLCINLDLIFYTGEGEFFLHIRNWTEFEGLGDKLERRCEHFVPSYEFA